MPRAALALMTTMMTGTMTMTMMTGTMTTTMMTTLVSDGKIERSPP